MLVSRAEHYKLSYKFTEKMTKFENNLGYFKVIKMWNL